MDRRWLYAAVLIACVAGAAPAAAAQEKSPASKAKPAAAATAATPLNLNTATVADLQALPGVGAATAKLIVAHREKNGGFKKIEELMNIKGIGEKSFLKLKPMVIVAAEKDKEKADRQEPSEGKR
jgi:competence protein ComEA